MKNLCLLFGCICFFACRDNTKSTDKAVEKISVMDTIPKSVSPKTVAVPIDTSETSNDPISYDYDDEVWTDIANLEASIVLDMRYATTNNFVKEQLYDCGRCFLRPEAAEALQQAQEVFQAQGLGLKMLDCFRPRPVQQKLWDKFRNPSYVTPPSKGSMHNRGLAVDLTLVDSTGQELDMGTPFDFFGKEAHHTHLDHSQEVLDHRKLLKSTMEAAGFRSIRTEWWHYSFPGVKYELSDMLWNCEGKG